MKTKTHSNVIRVPNVEFVEVVESVDFDKNINKTMLKYLREAGCEASDFEIVKMHNRYGANRTAPNRKQQPYDKRHAEINAFDASKILECKFNHGEDAAECQRDEEDEYAQKYANAIIANDFDCDFTPVIAVDKRMTYIDKEGAMCLLLPVTDRAREAVGKFIQFIDGQHRLAALFDKFHVRKYVFDGDENAEIIIDAKFLIGDFSDEEYKAALRKVFLDMNTTQRPMDKTHSMMQEYYLHIMEADERELVDALIRMNKDEANPLFNKIWFGKGKRKIKENRGKLNAETLEKNNKSLVKNLRAMGYNTVEQRYAVISKAIVALAEVSNEYFKDNASDAQKRANPNYDPFKGVKGGKVAWAIGQVAPAVHDMHEYNVRATQANMKRYWRGVMRLVSGVEVNNDDAAAEKRVKDLAHVKGDAAQYIVNPATKNVNLYDGTQDRFGGGSNIRSSMVRDAKYVCLKLFNS